MSRVWFLARALLLASLVPLAVTLVALIVPVRSPGVQDCGSPAAFLAAGREDIRLPRPGDAEFTPATPQLALQRPCTARVDDRLVLAAWTGGAFLVLAGAGAILGLIDDRMGLHRAPRFESLLRERPEGAPGRHWDRPVIPEDDLGRQLPEVETNEVLLLVGGGVGVWVLLALVAGWGATIEALRTFEFPHFAVMVVGVVAMFGAAAAELLSIRRGEPSSFGSAARISVNTAFEARVRPSFSWSGVWLHRLVGLGVRRDRAHYEVSTVATAGVSVHAALAVVASLAWLVGLGSRHRLPSLAWLVGIAIAVLVLWGSSTARARYRQLLAPPGRPGLRALGALGRTEAPRFAALVASALGLVVADIVVAVAAVSLVGGGASVPAVGVATVLALALGPLSPAGDGIGLTELLFVVILWRVGMPPAAAVAAGLWWRLATFWLPMVPGAIVRRSRA